jgi:hypothetical protein
MGLCTRNRPESLGGWLKLGYSDTGFASGIPMAALWGVNKFTAEPELNLIRVSLVGITQLTTTQ